MKRRHVLLDVAQRQILEQVAWYAEHAGARVAARFFAAFRETINAIELHPRRGRLLVSAHPNLVGVRMWLMRDFPFLIYYRERALTVEVLLLLHGARDRDRWLQ